MLCGTFFYLTNEILGARKSNVKSIFHLEVSSTWFFTALTFNQHSIFMWFLYLEFRTTVEGLLALADPAGWIWCFHSKDLLPPGIHKRILVSSFFWGSLSPIPENLVKSVTLARWALEMEKKILVPWEIWAAVSTRNMPREERFPQECEWQLPRWSQSISAPITARCLVLLEDL